MNRRAFPLALTVLAAAFALGGGGCSSLEMPGSARYYSNVPAGRPFFKVASGLGGPTLSVQKDDGTWTKPHTMKSVSSKEPPLSSTPGLAPLVESAHRIDDYVFLEFKPAATFQGQPVPSRYFLLPGGFAYPVSRP